MSKPLDVVVLEKARTYVANPKTWCKWSEARTKGGRKVDPWDDRAVRFCAGGAVGRAAYELTGSVEIAVQRMLDLDRAAWGARKTCIANINDGKGGRPAVLEVLDELISKHKE